MNVFAEIKDFSKQSDRVKLVMFFSFVLIYQAIVNHNADKRHEKDDADKATIWQNRATNDSIDKINLRNDLNAVTDKYIKSMFNQIQERNRSTEEITELRETLNKKR